MNYIHLILCLLLAISSFLVSCSINPIDSVLFLILCFFDSAILAFFFNFEFLGLAFVIIYVGAIAVLFLFIIMMLNIKFENFKLIDVIIEDIFIFLYVMILALVLSYDFLNEVFFNQNLNELLFDFTNFFLSDDLKNIDTLGQVLYNNFLSCFLISGLILLIALIGSISLTIQQNIYFNTQISQKQLSRSDNFLSFFK